MANVLVEESSLSNIASAIRVKNGSTSVYKPGEMAAAITNLPTGGSGGGNEDGLLADTLVNYENTTATKIKDYCFYQSNTLTTATFSNADEVGLNAFSNCKVLSQINLPKATKIGVLSFYKSKLSTVNLPNAMMIDSSAFKDNVSLTLVNLPRLQKLYAGTFQGCNNLTKVDLGSCRSFSGKGQFLSCNKLTALILRYNELCFVPYPVNRVADGALYNTPITNSDAAEPGYVYVPRALVDEYKNATNWTVIASRIRAIEDYPEITGGYINQLQAQLKEEE